MRPVLHEDCSVRVVLNFLPDRYPPDSMVTYPREDLDG